ncbi:MAG: DUF2079 domain-containing protein [Deltaproteobacteria bacterium]|nr:DUF2079 domain-containing protein [Deltaproteobacteria bacterium]
MKRPLLLIIAAGLVFITLPLFFERLHSDEVIYWEVAKNISIGLGPISETSGNSIFSWHMPLAFYIVAPFLKLSAHIFTARAVSSFFTIASAVLIFLICRKRAGADEALISALLFIFSFQVLRFGGRYYLDQYGLFFFLLSLYLLHEERFFISGTVAVTAVAAREYWAGVYPFLLLYLGLRDRRALPGFILTAAAVTLFFTLYTVYSKDSYGLWRYLAGGAALDNIKASVSGVVAYPLARGWVEFSVLNILTLAGFFAAFRIDKSHIVIVIPQVIVISLIHGFVLEGGVTQYPLALIGTLAVYSGPGLKNLYDRLIGPINGRQRFKSVVLLVVAAQFVFFNAFSTAVSLHKNLGVYGFGYGDDREVISILNREAKGEFIHGIWGAFVEKRGRWDWTDYLVQEAVEKDPDWLVTYDNYVEVIGGQNGSAGFTVYRVGPYVMIHSRHRGPLKGFVRSKVFPKWTLRTGVKVKD